MASSLSLAQWANLFQQPLVMVPGLHGSCRQHWQSQWQARFPHAVRAELEDWSTPSLARWQAAIGQALKTTASKPLLVGHSFGSLASAIFAAKNPQLIGGLLLVAPASPDKFNLRGQFQALPAHLPALVIGSANDPWMPEVGARELADILESDYHLAGALGHINVAGGVGAWWDGLQYLRQVAEQVAPQAHQLSVSGGWQALRAL